MLAMRPLDILVYAVGYLLPPLLGMDWARRRGKWPSAAAARTDSAMVWAVAPIGFAAGIACGLRASTGYWYPIVYLLGALAGGLGWMAWRARQREGRDHTAGVAASLVLAFVALPAGIVFVARWIFELERSLLASHEVLGATAAAYLLALVLLSGPARPRERPALRE